MADAAVRTKPATTAADDTERELTDGFHLVIDALKLNGIDTIYGVPGIPITDLGRMAQAAGMRVISFRHEQNAGNAAAIAGFLTKKPGICLTVSAPGFLNGLTALANATTNCFPMILISGSSEREIVDLQQGDYEEMDQLAIAKPLCKAAFRVLHAADIGIGLCVRGAFAEDDERTLGAADEIECALHGVRRRDLARCRIDDLDQRILPRFRVDGLREQFRGQVEIHAAGPAGERSPERPRHAHSNVLGVQDAERGLGVRPGDGELVHLLIVTLLQVDDLALARAADQDHREAVGGGIGERRQAVEKAGGGHREADARLLRHEAGDGSGIPGVLLVAEGDHAQSGALQLAREVGDRDSRQAEDRIDAVELEGIDDELKAVDLFLCLAVDLAASGDFRCVFGRRSRRLGRCFYHGVGAWFAVTKAMCRSFVWILSG